MQKYTEAVKEKNKVFYYIYCGECDEAYEDDLYYLATPKPCPNRCECVPCLIRSEQPIEKEKIKEIAEEYINEMKIKKFGQKLGIRH